MQNYQQLKIDLPKKRSTWLVTGAAGFIGSHLAERLLELNQNLVLVDNLATGQKKNLDYLQTVAQAKNPKGLKIVLGDICDIDLCSQVMREVDYVLHQAAIGSVPRSIEQPLYTHHSNVTGFLNVLKTASEAKVKRFVYASSSSVYGDSEELPKKEGHEGNLLSPYAATKAIDETYASVFAKVYKTAVVGLRYFNVFGPRQNPEGPYAAVIPLWIKQMLNGESVSINGDGSYSRDFCYIENVIQANLLAATCGDQALDKSYNIAVGDRTNLIQLYQQIKASILKCLPDAKISPYINRDFRAGDIPHSLADIGLAKNLLGYFPEYNLQKGMDLTVKYFLETERDHQ